MCIRCYWRCYVSKSSLYTWTIIPLICKSKGNSLGFGFFFLPMSFICLYRCRIAQLIDESNKSIFALFVFQYPKWTSSIDYIARFSVNPHLGLKNKRIRGFVTVLSLNEIDCGLIFNKKKCIHNCKQQLRSMRVSVETSQFHHNSIYSVFFFWITTLPGTRLVYLFTIRKEVYFKIEHSQIS